MLAEKINQTTVTIKHKVHDGDKLYSALNPSEIADALTASGISVSKSQVIIDKSIKNVGTHTVTIKLSSRLKPTLTIKVIAEK